MLLLLLQCSALQEGPYCHLDPILLLLLVPPSRLAACCFLAMHQRPVSQFPPWQTQGPGFGCYWEALGYLHWAEISL
jgi:hypothetical protein